MPDSSSAEVCSKFFRRWVATKGGNSGLSLCRIIFLFAKSSTLSPIIPKALLIVITFSQKILLDKFLNFVNSPEANKRVGYSIAGYFALIYGARAIFNAQYAHAADKFAFKARIVLISTIYEQLLGIDLSEGASKAVVNVMNVDVESVVQGIRNIHEIWATGITVIIASILLYHQLSLA